MTLYGQKQINIKQLKIYNQQLYIPVCLPDAIYKKNLHFRSRIPNFKMVKYIQLFFFYFALYQLKIYA